MFYNVFRKSCRLWHNAQTCCNAGQATDDNMAHENCMLYNKGNKQKLTIYL